MKLRMISAATLIAVISTFTAPAYAVTTQYVPSEYTFSASDAAEDVLEGTAIGSSAWNETLSNFATLSGGTLTVSSTRKAAFVSLSEAAESAAFEMTADLTVSVQNNRSSSDYATGFAFAATEDGYYQLMFASDETAHIIKTSSLTATSGTSVASASIAGKMSLDGSAAAAVKLAVSGKKAKLYIGNEEVLSYDSETDFPKGGFGFVTKRDMSAVYESFKLMLSKEVLVYEESDYAVASYIAEVSGNAAVLSWTNPNVPSITDIVIKDTNGNTITYSGTIAKTQGAENTVTVSSLKHNVEYGLRLVVSFSDHADKSSETKYVTLPFTVEDYEIADFSAVSMIEAGKLSWKNPAAGVIESIAITDADGNPYSVNVSKEAGAKNEVKIDVPGGETVTFTVTITFVGGETVSESGTITAVVLEEAKYYPKNVLVYESYTKIGLSWLNPEKEIKSVKVIDCKTGLEAETEDSVSGVSGAANNVLMTGLASDSNANYRIIFEFTDGHDAVEYIAGGLPYGKGSYYDYEQNTYAKVTDWDVFYNLATASYGQIPAYISVDRDEKVSGESSVKMAASFADVYNNVFYQLRLKPLESYDTDHTYRISMKVKYKNAKNGVVLAYANKPMNSYADGTAAPTYSIGTNLTPKDSSNGWETVSYIMKPTDLQGNPRGEGLELCVRLIGTAESFWVDDIEMVPIDENGNAIGENILPNPELESSDNTPCGNVKLLSDSCSLKDAAAVLSWENPDDNTLKNIKIYRKVSGELYECATLSNTATEISIGNVTSDETAVFVIKTVDDADNISSGVEVELKPQLSNIVIGDIVFKNGDSMITQIPPGFDGRVTASVSVTNNGAESFEGSLWLTVYENGILKTITASDTTIFAKGSGTKTAEASASVTTGCVVKAFFLDNIENMKLLTSEAELK